MSRIQYAVLACLCAAATLGGSTPLRAQATSAPAVLRTMSADETRATGIEKLTPEERARLEAWITRLATNVARMAVATERDQTPAGSHQGALESRLVGDFTGWDGMTVFQLENGQIWQQTSFDRLAIYVARPRVTLISVRDGWRMSVDGIGQTIAVRRIR